MFLPESRMQHNIWESINKHFKLTNMHLRINFLFGWYFCRENDTRLFSERVRYYWRMSLYHWFEWATLDSLKNVSISLCTVKQVEIERCCYGYFEIVCAFFFLLDFSSFVQFLYWNALEIDLTCFGVVHTKSVKHCAKLRLMHSNQTKLTNQITKFA